MSEYAYAHEAQDGAAAGSIQPSSHEVLWGSCDVRTPERELALEIIRQAAHDLRHFRGARTTKHRRLYNDAHDWVRSCDDTWPFSFVNLCAALGLSSEALRAMLLRDPLDATRQRQPS